MRFAAPIPLLLVAGALLAPPAHAAGPALTATAEGRFPDRTFVLSLPERRDLRTADVDVSENGRPVSDLSVVPAGSGNRGSGVVLAIDASQTMRGRPIEDAMAAARAFVRSRRPNQSVGVVFFSRDARVALAPTRDARRIARTVASPPEITKGTRLYDATARSIELLKAARISAGTVVVLSDGADVGSRVTPAQLSATARKAGVRIFTVGLDSSSFAAGPLIGIARGGNGRYTRAASSGQLKRIYAGLGAELANEYLVTYRSLARLGTPVRAQASVRGIPTPAVASYAAPPPPSAPVASSAGTGDGPFLPAGVVAVVVALLLGLAAWLAFLRPRRSVGERIRDYALVPTVASAKREALRPQSALGRSLGRNRRWSSFGEEAELAGIRMAPARLVAITLVVTVLLVWLAAAAGREVAAFVLAFTPLGVWLAIRARVARRRRAFAASLGDTLQVMASAMRAGHSFTGAMSVAVEDLEEPGRSELMRVVRDEQLGVPIEKAMADAARRMDNTELDHAGTVAALQRESGGNTAEVIDRLVETIRGRDELRGLVRSLTAQGRAAGTVLTLLPIGLTLTLSAASPGFFDPMLASPSGRLALAAGALFVLLGWFAIRKIANVKV